MHYLVKVSKDLKSEIIETESLNCSDLAKEINCDYIEMASIDKIQISPRFCMLVDEDGSLKADKEINVIASSLYGYEIYGDVLIAREIINKYGARDYISLDKDLAERLNSMFIEIITKLKSKGESKYESN